MTNERGLTASCSLIAKFHYTGATGFDWTGPDPTRQSPPTLSGRARVVGLSYYYPSSECELFRTLSLTARQLQTIGRIAALQVFSTYIGYRQDGHGKYGTCNVLMRFIYTSIIHSADHKHYTRRRSDQRALCLLQNNES